MLTVVTTNNMKIIVAECPEFSGTGSSIQSYAVPKPTLKSYKEATIPCMWCIERSVSKINATALGDGKNY